MEKETTRLEGKCQHKDMAEIKASKGFSISLVDAECLYRCNGYNKFCSDYTGLTSRERILSYSKR